MHKEEECESDPFAVTRLLDNFELNPNMSTIVCCQTDQVIIHDQPRKVRLPALPFALRSLIPWHHLCHLLRSEGKTWLFDPQHNCKISPRIKEFLIRL
ncbi:hypothetical protein Q7C36_010969 [Tachysurus vachellii]|uniref:Uncharacterized protein n=1 Tax=Tachysurus vachellii TaxID=175792 RepID=A0AA88MWL4_TACVA|nr:hypothetical protein Q7C36_010969 [Tachysurus vachellii]